MYVDPHLPRHQFGWYSSRLGLEMPIVSYGTGGHPLLLLPTAQADYLENERFYLIKSIEPYIFAGKIQVFSIDSINRHAWMNRKVPVREAARRNALYAGYIEEEVVPTSAASRATRTRASASAARASAPSTRPTSSSAGPTSSTPSSP